MYSVLFNWDSMDESETAEDTLFNDKNKQILA